jgi:type IV pilus assembly protein PilB
MALTERLKEMVISCAAEPDLAAVAHEEGMLTLREDGVVKVRAGLTSLEEVLRVTA